MIVLTLDSDWAPDYVLEHALGILRSAGVRSTHFLTNPTAVAWGPGEELGLHPNLAKSSTQGEDEDAILDHLQGFLPGAECLRVHRLNWNHGLYAKLPGRGIRIDSSCVRPLYPGLAPLRHAGLTRLPIWWSDGLHLRNQFPLTELAIPNLEAPGLKVFNFHPIHLYLNITHMADYAQAMAATGGYGPHIPQERLEPLRNRGVGIANMLEALLEHMLRRGKPSLHLHEIAAMDDQEIRHFGGLGRKSTSRGTQA